MLFHSYLSKYRTAATYTVVHSGTESVHYRNMHTAVRVMILSFVTLLDLGLLR